MSWVGNWLGRHVGNWFGQLEQKRGGHAKQRRIRVPLPLLAQDDDDVILALGAVIAALIAEELCRRSPAALN